MKKLDLGKAIAATTKSTFVNNKLISDEQVKKSIEVLEELRMFIPPLGAEEFSLLDCCLGPLLWRLPLLGVELPEASTKPIAAYMERIFERDSFQKSLTELEREIREHEYV